MRQPNFGPPRERAQAGFQKVDKEKRATLLRMSSFVFKHYKWAIMVVMVCVVISSLTSLVSSLFTKTLIDDYVVPLTQVDNPEYQSLAQTLFVIGLILFFGTVCSYTYNRLMIYISQGTMLRLRKRRFSRRCNICPSVISTNGRTVTSCPSIPTMSIPFVSLSPRQ